MEWPPLKLRKGQSFNFGVRSRLTGIGIAGRGIVVHSETEVEKTTHLTRSSFHVLRKAGVGIFDNDILTAYWDDKNIRYRVFKEGVIDALEGMLNRQDEMTIVVRGMQWYNAAIGMESVVVDSWMAK